MAVIWRTIDWPKMEQELAKKQQDLAYAAYNRQWDEVERLQRELVCSWAARVLAVRAVADTNAQAGVDGVRWKSDIDKARAAQTLTNRGYRPLPYRHTEIEENGKHRVIHVPAQSIVRQITAISSSSIACFGLTGFISIEIGQWSDPRTST